MCNAFASEIKIIEFLKVLLFKNINANKIYFYEAFLLFAKGTQLALLKFAQLLILFLKVLLGNGVMFSFTQK